MLDSNFEYQQPDYHEIRTCNQSSFPKLLPPLQMKHSPNEGRPLPLDYTRLPIAATLIRIKAILKIS